MANLDVALPEQAYHLARKGAARADFEDVGDYLAALIAQDLARAEMLEEAIQEGLDSGIIDRPIDDIVAEIKGRYRADQAA